MVIVTPAGSEAGDKKVFVGSVAQTKELYAKYDAQKKRSWSEKPPSDIEDAVENEETQKFAIIVRKSKSSSKQPPRLATC